ncbi:MAG: ABC transporter permease [Bryobacteraceae bacterium]|jgi:predicted permease
MLNDFRYAFRTLRQNPGFALVAILSLALGIGANSAIFSFADALLLRPLPVPQPSRVVSVVSRWRGEGFGELSYKDYIDFRNKSRSFEGFAALQLIRVGFATSKDALPQMKAGFLASGDSFRALRVEPELGRSFRPEEDQAPGRDAVAVISHDLWQTEFASNRDVIGKTIFLNGISFTIIGVAPESFTGVDQFFHPALFVPLMMSPRLAATPEQSVLERRDDRGLTVKARLKPGVSVAQANAEAEVIGKQLEQAYPDTNRNCSAAVRTEFQVRVDRSPYDAMLMGFVLALVGVVLLIACANVANLLLSRARARSREIAVRLAIGAGRTRLIRQLLTESLAIAVLGGALGLLLAQAGIETFSHFRIPSDIPLSIDAKLDLRVTLYALFASIASALLFGLAPALQATRTDLVQALKSGVEGARKRQRFLGRNTLVIAQVAGSLLLLVCATQLFRATSFVLSAPPGFRTDHLLMTSFDPTLVRYTPAQTQIFYRRLEEQTRALPGVKSAALARLPPLSNYPIRKSVVPEGFQLPPGKESVTVPANIVSEGYFETVDVPILQGRDFRMTDSADSPRVAIASEQFARKFYPNQDPVGKRFRLDGRDGPPVEIVGLAKQSKYFFLAEPPQDFLYLPLAQNPQTQMTLLARSHGDPAALAGPIRDVVRSLDPDQPVYGVRTMEEYFDLRARKFFNWITETIGAMGLLGLALALVGLYGLMSYSVSRRMREIGIRMAIGADRVNVVRMVLKQGLLLAGIGVAIGILLSVLFSRALTAGLAGVVPSFNLTMMALVSLALLGVAMLGAYVPARRASLVDPMRVLRED